MRSSKRRRQLWITVRISRNGANIRRWRPHSPSLSTSQVGVFRRDGVIVAWVADMETFVGGSVAEGELIRREPPGAQSGVDRSDPTSDGGAWLAAHERLSFFRCRSWDLRSHTAATRVMAQPLEAVAATAQISGELRSTRRDPLTGLPSHAPMALIEDAAIALADHVIGEIGLLGHGVGCSIGKGRRRYTKAARGSSPARRAPSQPPARRYDLTAETITNGPSAWSFRKDPA